jgi:Bacterial extracellular solute-binding protein/von Willebrand factor type A domain
MGRHSRPFSSRWQRPVLAVAVVAIMVAAAGWAVADRMTCDDPTVVRVAAAPDIAPLVAQVARDLPDPGCTTFAVQDRLSTDQAQALAIADGSEPAQVWIPESSLHLVRARDLGAAAVPLRGQSIASSPVVMALCDEAAQAWRASRPSWSDVLADDSVTVGVPDPTRTSVGLAALLETQAVSRTAPDPQAGFTAALRRLAAHTTVESADLYGQLPGMPGVARPVTAFATSEQAMLRHNVTSPDEQLTAAYPESTATELDYPFTVLDTAAPAQRDAAARLLTALQGGAGRATLADGGFRTPDGAMLRDRSQGGRIAADLPPLQPLAGSPVATEALTRWATVNRSARVRVLIDVSGSMEARVPGLDISRMTATLQAAEAGLRLFQPTTRLGFWTFSTKLDGDRDYREVAPVTAVRDLLTNGAVDALRAIRAKPGGGTGLNDSLIAAYREALTNWEPGRLNLVIVMTDGNNEDSAGITHAQLLEQLRATADPRRPVTVIGVAIGPDIDPAELDEITATTGGRSFVAPDPGRIKDVFFAALAALKPQ